MRAMRWMTALALILCGCSSIFGPKLPYWTEGARPYQLPAEAAEWYAELQECAGIEKPLSGLRWYVADELDSAGAFIGPRDAYLAPEFEGDPYTIIHEMGHYLLHPSDGHPAPVFGTCDRILADRLLREWAYANLPLIH